MAGVCLDNPSIYQKDMYKAAFEIIDKADKVRDKVYSVVSGVKGGGDKATQKDLDKICKKWDPHKEILRPGEKNELFRLFSDIGKPYELVAPRWLCHFFKLRHKCVHVLLRWTEPMLGNVFVLQIRSWDKADSPGYVDISVGGHTPESDCDDENNAYREMKEEIGLVKKDLSHELLSCGGYVFDEEREDDNFYNSEWRKVYVADINTEALKKIRFKDNEVVGLYLCPEMEIKNLIDCKKNKSIPIASALRGSLTKCIKFLNGGSTN